MSSPSEPKEQGGAAGGGTGTRVFFVDAFTETAFEGNPAAVIATEGEKLPDDKMQLMAREFNMVTAFVVLEAAKRTIYWYTATDELLLCGHGTIAACKALVGMGLLGLGEDVEFASRAGWTLGARHESDGTISLTFPASPLSAVPREEFTGESMAWVWSSLGIDIARVPADSHGAGAHVVRTEYDLLIRLESTAVVDALAPDHAALARGCKAMGFRGVIVTALDEAGRREGNDDMER
jgi:PhzF family phenazine biosynthesis protein